MRVDYPAQYHSCLASHHLIYKSEVEGWIMCLTCHHGDFLRYKNGVLELTPMNKQEIDEILVMIDEDEIHDPWL